MIRGNTSSGESVAARQRWMIHVRFNYEYNLPVGGFEALMVEHSVKLAQFISTGMQVTPGIVEMHLDGVIFHALMNTVVLVPVVIVFFCSGIHRELFRRSAGQTPPEGFQRHSLESMVPVRRIP